MGAARTLRVFVLLAVGIGGCDPGVRTPDGGDASGGGVDSLVVEWDAPAEESAIDRPRGDRPPEFPPPLPDPDAGLDAPEAESPVVDLTEACPSEAVDAAVEGHRFGVTTVLYRRANQLRPGGIAALLRDGCPSTRATTRWFAVRFTPRVEARLSLAISYESPLFTELPRRVAASVAIFADCDADAGARRVACARSTGPPRPARGSPGPPLGDA